jgi:hypothetical protein
MDCPATEPRLSADKHDPVLALALGALSAICRFEDAVGARSSEAALDPDDPIVVASLGVVSLGRTLRRWLEEAAEPHGTAARPEPVEPSVSPRELLR